MICNNKLYKLTAAGFGQCLVNDFPDLGLALQEAQGLGPLTFVQMAVVWSTQGVVYMRSRYECMRFYNEIW